MDPAERIRKIEEFVHLQPYLRGLLFHVIEDPEDDDKFIIEFENASARQLGSLRNALVTRLMVHIRCRNKIKTKKQ